MGDMNSEQHNREVTEEDDVEFKWGKKLEVDEPNPTSQLYESFVYDGTEYSLFDCVFMGTEPEFSIGKLVKMWELPNHKRMVEVVWFYCPGEIKDLFGDDEPLRNELLLASGEGIGLSNVNPLESICGKCNVVCTSKDRRNPQATELELSMADFIFLRTFDVGSCRVVDNFPDTIAGIKVDFFFNRQDKGCVYPGIIPPDLNECVEKLTIATNIQHPQSVRETFNCNSYGTKLSPIAEDKKADTQGVGISSEGKTQLKYKDFSVNDVPENQPMKRMKSPALSEDVEMQSSPSPKTNEKSSTKILQKRKFDPIKRDLDTMDFSYQDQKISKGVTTVQQASKFADGKSSTRILQRRKFGPMKRDMDTMDFSYQDKKTSEGVTTMQKASMSANEEVPGLCENNKVKTNRHFTEVKRKPYNEKRSWFLQPWEEKVQRANERGTLILLENLDPSFCSLEVEDLAWQCFGEDVEAKMIQQNYFCWVDYGRALVIFKSQLAAELAISELEKRCLMLEHGRTIVGRRAAVEKPEKLVAFVGHLTIPKAKLRQQRQEMREARSTAHCSQANTIEYDMAMEWRLLQEQSDNWWNLINEKHAREIQKHKSQLRIWHKD